MEFLPSSTMSKAGPANCFFLSPFWSFWRIKATCLGMIDRVQKKKSRVTITRHGKPAAELIPISASSPGKLFGRSVESTVIIGEARDASGHLHVEILLHHKATGAI